MAGDLKFDFYELIPPKGMADPYAEITAALSQAHRPVSVDKVPYRVESFSQSEEGYIFGTASRTELSDLPVVIRPTEPGFTPLDGESFRLCPCQRRSLSRYRVGNARRTALNNSGTERKLSGPPKPGT